MILLPWLWGCTTATDSGDAPASTLPDGLRLSWACGGEAAGFDKDATAFVEATDAWGLAPFTAGQMIAFDADGDAWPDLLVHEAVAEGRDDPAGGVYYHRLLLNRDEGGRRVFVDFTDDSGLLVGEDGAPGTGHGAYAAGDVDGDGDLDLFAGRYHDRGNDDVTGERNTVYLNDGSAHFTRLADSGVGSESAMPTMSASFTEVDGDGVLDLWVVNWYADYSGSMDSGPPLLYRGRGDGTFEDVTDGTAMDLKPVLNSDHWQDRKRRRPGFGATACDVDGDGAPELIQSSYARTWNLMFGQRGGEWAEVGEGSGMDADDNLDYSDNLYYVCYCEVTGDCPLEPAYACPDTAYASWTPGYDDAEGRLAGNTFTTVCGDLDNDGDMDLYNTEIQHEWAGQSADQSQLLLNDGSGQFERLSNDDEQGLLRKAGSNHSDLGDLQAGFFDFDNDGWQDVVLVESDYPDTQMWVWHNQAGGGFEEQSAETGLDQPWPHGLALADFDRDGDVDLVTGSSHARSGSPWTVNTLHLYENQLGGSSVRIEGAPIGARLQVEAGGVTQTFEVGGGYGVGILQHDLALTVGLDGACAIDDLVYTPPFGETQRSGPLSPAE